jgi:hypothetical protein
MEVDVMINLSELKMEKIRCSFDVDINGVTEEVVIFNLVGEEREEIRNKMIELTQQGLTEEEVVQELYTDVFIQCTNIVVDEDIIEVLNAPKLDMLKVLQEVNEIIHEIEMEQLIENYQNLCQLETIEYTKLTLLKSEHLELIARETNKVEKEIEKFKKGVK